MDQKRVNGVDLAYRTAGDPAGQAAVLIHGYTGNIRNWALTIRPLTQAGFRTLSADNPGHGHSGSPEDPSHYTLAAMAGTQHALARELGFAPAVVIGHSMGGAIAEEYAIRYPGDVRALVLVGSAGGGPRNDPGMQAMARMMEEGASIAMEQGMAALWDHQLASGQRVLPGGLAADTVSFLKAEFALTSPQGYINCAKAMRDRRNTLPELAALGKPTLIIRGENEGPGLVEASNGLAAAIPGARYEIIPGAGHSPQFEAPEHFARVLLDFLARLPELARA